ncbi:MAG: GNAT family N-acetyltransferase [Clostridiales bacterium]|nr:GNAT family N-acetyltransferase [Clostridiales bacterium]
MITYKKINVDNRQELIELMENVLNKLERKEFFIPFTENEIEELFQENNTISYGAFHNEKLVGTAQLYLEDNFIKNIKKEINLVSDKVAELGGYLVLEEYRNEGILKELEKRLIKEAKEKDYEYIVVTVHPDNLPSNKAVEFTGAKIVKTTKFGEYLRNIYLLKL